MFIIIFRGAKNNFDSKYHLCSMCITFVVFKGKIGESKAYSREFTYCSTLKKDSLKDVIMDSRWVYHICGQTNVQLTFTSPHKWEFRT